MTSNIEGRVPSGIECEDGVLPDDVQDRYLDDSEYSCDLELMHSYDSGDSQADKVDCKAQKVSGDVADLLPKDPFGMGFNAAVTSFTGWFEDISLKNLDFESMEAGVETVDHHVVAELNIFWKGSALFHYDTPKTKSSSGFKDELFEECYYESLDKFTSFDDDKYCYPPDEYRKPNGCVEDNIFCVELGPPPDALVFVLGYLGVRDLLSVERVCKSLRDAVQTDPLIWRNIQIDHPLSGKITDDVLVHLAQRAQGSLHSLSLIGCRDITDVGLKRVLETNTRLMQLNARGCLALSIQCVIANLKQFKSIGRPGIKSLGIGGLFGVSGENIEELKLLLSDENQKLPGSLKPRLFHSGKLFLSLDDDRHTDIAACPRCDRVRQVFDCPADSCRGKWDTPQSCRACSLCINRCINCGRCLSNCDYEETFFLECICLDCLKEIDNCQDNYSPLCQSTVLVVHLQQ